VRAGAGDDVVAAFGGGVTLWGNAGDDVLFVGHGDNQVIPGAGLDTVSLGNGDNTIVILDVCEIEEGEQIEAGDGHDVLIAPVGAAELAELGVALSGIDEIVVDTSRGCASECRLVSESCGE
jgi:Ca2+-binding RTX toxin-like protein